MSNGTYHEPVMPNESTRYLDIKPDGTYIDLTLGGGGHTRMILEQLGPQGRLLAFDQDEAARANLPNDQRLIFVPQNFRYLERFARFYGISEVDGILADLGVSSYQLDMPERGFSYRYPEQPLDMRMDISSGKKANELLWEMNARELQQMFSEYGEVRNARTLAKAIVEQRQMVRIMSGNDLLRIVTPLIKGDRHRYLAQVYQSLRIKVNDEMGSLRDALEGSLAILRAGGRLVVLSYHSLEDGMVKRFMRDGNMEGEMKKDEFGKIDRPFVVVTKKPITASKEEIERNPRAHSARLRVAIKRQINEAD